MGVKVLWDAAKKASSASIQKRGSRFSSNAMVVVSLLPWVRFVAIENGGSIFFFSSSREDETFYGLEEKREE